MGGVFFLGSYTPLWLILGIRQWNATREIAELLLVVAVVSAVAMWGIIAFTRRSIASIPVRITAVSSRESDAVAYLVTYILPLIDVPFTDVTKAASLLVLLVVTGFIYLNSCMFFVNPLLSIFGYHLFEIQTDSGETQILLSRVRHHRVGSEVQAIRLADYVLLEATA
ncbi:MAG: hypothetical protein E6J20_17170 [Chloroflexi bacterium]|nr:MAG: hypothetical protein E6J20_17170 [Chloroflexota bacterium]